MSTSRCILCISFLFSWQERAWVLNVCFSHPSTLFSSGVSAYLSLVSAFRCSLFSFFTLLSSRRVYNLARYSEEINTVFNSRFIYSQHIPWSWMNSFCEPGIVIKVATFLHDSHNLYTLPLRQKKWIDYRETFRSNRGGSMFFLGGGGLFSCSTSTPINHIVFFFCRIPVVLENRRSSQGGGGVRTPCTLPLDPPLVQGR